MSDHDDIITEDSFPEEAAEAPAAAITIEGKTVWRVKVLYSSSTEFCESPEGLEVKVGDTVVVPTRYGNELGRILGRETDAAAVTGELRTVIRVAAQNDLLRFEENDTREERAFEICREKIDARGLPMKLVSAHYILDEQKILFFFTAENRVDFRELVKDLVTAFRTRIELRQIGVRDEARVVGGLGICGRALCCNSVTDRLRPVSIKMAKEQNLTLNSMKISGPCGRLLCCLSYEFDVYRDARQTLPGMGTRIRFDGEDFRVTDMNVLTRRLRFQGESGRVLDVGFDSLTRNPQTQAWELRGKAGADNQ
ncbi:MAG TPA: stage 0 sporulation family protein [Spirochaetia bacterium]|nr:stage 0 sporulation family protein [Spirochaetia bacterium]